MTTLIQNNICGIITTFLPADNYGFIKGEDGNHYHFKTTCLKAHSKVSKVVSGLMVNFTPKATSEGYSASSVDIPQTYVGKKLSEFSYTKYSYLEKGTVEATKTIRSQSYENANEAKDDLLTLAQADGSTGVINVTCVVNKVKLHGRVYTEYSYTGEAVITSEEILCENEEEVLLSNQIVNNAIAEFSETYVENKPAGTIEIVSIIAILLIVTFGVIKIVG